MDHQAHTDPHPCQDREEDTGLHPVVDHGHRRVNTADVEEAEEEADGEVGEVEGMTMEVTVPSAQRQGQGLLGAIVRGHTPPDPLLEHLREDMAEVIVAEEGILRLDEDAEAVAVAEGVEVGGAQVTIPMIVTAIAVVAGIVVGAAETEGSGLGMALPLVHGSGAFSDLRHGIDSGATDLGSLGMSVFGSSLS